MWSMEERCMMIFRKRERLVRCVRRLGGHVRSFSRRRLRHQVAIGIDLTLRIYREVLVLQMLGHGSGLLRLDLLGRGHAQITQRNAPAPTIEHGAERAEQKGQPITSFARQKRKEFRGGFEPQPLQTVANLSPSPAHRSSVSTLRAGCERSLS